MYRKVLGLSAAAALLVRGIIIKSVGLEELWRQLGLLTLLGVVVFSTAVLRFQKRIDQLAVGRGVARQSGTLGVGFVSEGVL